jgi:hypothetical protein
MTRRRMPCMRVPTSFSLILLGLALGCAGRSGDSGSNGNDHGDGSGGSVASGGPYCLPPALADTSAVCISCMENLCGTACKAFSSGGCPVDAVTPMCMAAERDIEVCQQQQCASQCDPNIEAGGAQAPMPSCAMLSACCPSLVVSNVTEENCKYTAASDYEPDCARELARDAKYCADPTLLNRAHPCIFATTGQCFIAFGVPDGQLGESAACMQAGGMQANFCPTVDLLGCCAVATKGETCFYSNASPPMSEAGCVKAGGVWSSVVR